VEGIFLEYGAIGAIALLGIVWFKVSMVKLQEAYEREKQRADRLEEELTQLNRLLRTEYMSAIQRSALALNDANRAVNEALGAFREGRG